MRNFIAHSACCGRRPKGLGLSGIHSRPRLIKKMMLDRTVARFVVAPQGFGKTALVCEYAESIFGFDNVFWINGQSPCFLRDLDDRIVVPSLSDASQRRSLVVFEDIPYLDDERSDAFSRDIDAILNKGWEVVVVATPATDSFAERQNDRTCISARDLLVDDMEASALGSALRGAGAGERVPALVWGGQDGGAPLLDGMRSADMPAEIQLAIFVMEVLVEGSVEDVDSFVHSLRKDTRRFIEQHYPYVGLDLVEERFCAHEFPIGAIGAAFRGVIDVTVASASSTSREALVCRLASTLARRGRRERACELVATLCSRRRRPSWIEAEQDGLLASGSVAPAQRLFESLGERPSGLTPALLLGASARLHLLGDDKRAVRFAMRALAHPDRSEEQACHAALAACVCAPDDIAARVRAALSDASVRTLGEGGAASLTAAAWSCMDDDPARALDIVEGAEASAIVQPVFLTGLARIVRTLNDGDGGSGRLLERACACASRCLDACRDAADADAYEAVLRDAVREAGLAAEGDDPREAEARVLIAALADQRRDWRVEATAALRLPARGAQPAPVQAAGAAKMRVRLFGGMQVSVGGQVIEPAAFRKQKAKALLAVLVLHRGKEIARQELLDIMWPDSSGERASNNLYSLWSALRRALEDKWGECPYVVRHQAGYMVDARYVESDVDEFEEICRTLFFDRPDPQAWMEVFARLQNDFSCDLLPSETGNAYIDRLRERYRVRLVDVLVTAADRLCDADEPQAALWFARAALDQCDEREDAYCALMRAQMLSDQRSQAMETFLACRRFMSEELGMDPSERVMRLHRELIAGKREGSPASWGMEPVQGAM